MAQFDRHLATNQYPVLQCGHECTSLYNVRRELYCVSIGMIHLDYHQGG